MLSGVMLFVQAVLAVGGLLLLRRLLGALEPRADLEIILDVWCPVAVIAPMLSFAARVESTVGGAGWILVGGPVAAGAMALGASLLTDRSGMERNRPAPWMMGTWTATGLVLLLLGSAHELTMLMGHCSFAAAAVLLWLNSPGPVASASGPARGAPTARVLVPVMACAIGQGAAAWMIGPSLVRASGAVAVAYAAMAVVMAARVGGATAGLRIGGWVAAYGVLFGLGLISLFHSVPQVVGVLSSQEPVTTTQVAYGFGHYAPEATALILLGAVAVAARRQRRSIRRSVGAVMIVATTAIIAWRLALV